MWQWSFCQASETAEICLSQVFFSIRVPESQWWQWVYFRLCCGDKHVAPHASFWGVEGRGSVHKFPRWCLHSDFPPSHFPRISTLPALIQHPLIWVFLLGQISTIWNLLSLTARSSALMLVYSRGGFCAALTKNKTKQNKTNPTYCMSLFVLKTNRDAPHPQTYTHIHNFTLTIPREDEWDFGRGEMDITFTFCFITSFTIWFILGGQACVPLKLLHF